MTTMSVTNKLVNKILSKSSDLCCLCLSTITGDSIGLDVEVALSETDIENIAQVAEIMVYVFGEELFSDDSILNEFCIECINMASSVYRFIKQSKENIQLLVNTTDQLKNCFEMVPENLVDCKTLFITLNSNSEITGQYYDNVVFAKNIPNALKRFKTIVDFHYPKIKQEIKKENLSLKKENTKINLKEIMTDKKVSNKLQLQCKTCLKFFNNVTALNEHSLRFHLPQQYKCEFCQKKFAIKKLLNQHKDKYHSNLVCSECGKSFRNKYCLRAHEKRHTAKYICPDCGRVYKNRATLKKHKENDICQHPYRHSPADAKFTCDYCQKRYTQKISLRVHIQYEHLGYKYLKCKWCDKKFYCQSRLNAHSVKHTKKKNYQCSFCGGKFVSKESLLYHTRIHTGEKPYQCPHCDSRFISASRRQAHVKSFHSDPTVECDICHNKFRSVQYLQKHKKIHFAEQSEHINSSVLQEEIVIADGDVKSRMSLKDSTEDFNIPKLKKNSALKTYSKKFNGVSTRTSFEFETSKETNNSVQEDFCIRTQLPRVETEYGNSPKKISENKTEAVICYKVENDGEIQEHLVF